MPCNSDYLQETPREIYNRQVAQFMVYVHDCLDLPSSPKLLADARNVYGGGDYTADLCTLLSQQDVATIERIVYDAHSSIARKLADWWERHQEADKERLGQEAIRRKQEIQAAREVLRKYGVE